jgi:Zn finger protein HypA/HybF involved in hydrogenase expression
MTLQNPTIDWKCPRCHGELKRIAKSQKYSCDTCTSDDAFVIWSDPYLQGFYDGRADAAQPGGYS